MILEDPYEKIEKFRREMDKLFNKYLKEVDIITAGRGKSNKSNGIERARVNIKKLKDGYEYSIEIPGVNKEDIEVNIINNILEIKARKKVDKKEKEKDYIYREVSTQEYYRGLPLPEDVDIKKVEASYENGVLKIKMGKKKVSKTKSTRKIKIK